MPEHIDEAHTRRSCCRCLQHTVVHLSSWCLHYSWIVNIRKVSRSYKCASLEVSHQFVSSLAVVHHMLTPWAGTAHVYVCLYDKLVRRPSACYLAVSMYNSIEEGGGGHASFLYKIGQIKFPSFSFNQ